METHRRRLCTTTWCKCSLAENVPLPFPTFLPPSKAPSVCAFADQTGARARHASQELGLLPSRPEHELRGRQATITCAGRGVAFPQSVLLLSLRRLCCQSLLDVLTGSLDFGSDVRGTSEAWGGSRVGWGGTGESGAVRGHKSTLAISPAFLGRELPIASHSPTTTRLSLAKTFMPSIGDDARGF